MQVVNKRFYTCSICGRTSIKEERIKDCEQSHIRIDEIAEIHTEYSKGANKYPEMVGVPMSNGKVAWYKYVFDKEVPNE